MELKINSKIKQYDNFCLSEIKENRFKTNSLVFSYKYKADFKDYVYMCILKNMFFVKNNKYDTKRKYHNRLLDIYNPRMSCGFRLSGRYMIFDFELSFLKEKYTEKNNDKKTIEMFLESIFNPFVINSEFDKELFESEIRRILDDLKCVCDNPDNYLYERFKQIFNKNTTQCYSLYEKEEFIKNISSKDLYNFYIKMINDGNLIISFMGETKCYYKRIIEKYLINRKNVIYNEEHFEKIELNNNPNIIIEKFNSQQSRIKMMYLYDNLSDFEKRYVIRLFDFILGGSPDSMLFKEVREKNSLCYKIYSSSSILNGTMQICAGINACNYDKFLDLINIEISKIQNGDFDDVLLENAITTLKNACIETLDSQYGIISSCMSVLYNINDSIDLRYKNIDKVTKKDIVTLANKLNLDTIYFLRGDE